jgi:hypothetical protein
LKKSFFFVAFTLIYSVASFATDTTKTVGKWNANWKKWEIQTKRIQAPTGKRLVAKVQVLDVRADTERFGVCTNNSGKTRQFVFDTSFDSVIRRNLVQKDGLFDILLVVRNFWLTEMQRQLKQSKNLFNILVEVFLFLSFRFHLMHL